MPGFLRVRSMLGVLVKDLPSYVPALWGGKGRYLGLCNPDEVLEVAPDGSGYRCDWQWTSNLHAPSVIPALGAKLMALALGDHPVCFTETPAECAGTPD